jgi:hypothetical protein
MDESVLNPYGRERRPDAVAVGDCSFPDYF